MTRVSFRQACGLALMLAAFGLPDAATPQEADGDFATLEAYRGQVSIVRRGSSVTPSLRMALERNDTVVTRRGTAAVRFTSDGSQVRVGPESRVQIDESAGERGIEVFFGRLWARIVSFRDRQTRVRTGSTIAAVRGTEVAVDYDEQQTLLWVFEGEMTAENPEGSLTVSTGQSAVAVAGSAPTMRVSVRPQDAVQWSLYYMPVLFDEVSGQEDWQQAIRESIDLYREGDLGGALDRIENISDASIDDPRFFTHRASLYLAAGSFDDANSDIDRALALEGNNADALSLQAVVAVALNDSERALTLAERAVAADAQSASAQIALSYAQQALFDLEGARATLASAADSFPDNALVWARLSELHLSFGELGNALDAARTSAEQEPDLVRSQTVLGYAYLTQVRTEEAKEAFRRAIELDQGDPVPRLGLGLALIREGDLDAGSAEIEVASSLDPGNAVVRSYLGKAYFEQKRTDIDEREFMLAKEVDPNDPTPWFYDAIAKQTTNEPVVALENLQEAIERNDNRAVYRSRLLLDSDLAARSASLGRIYSDLGFQQRALVEGWNSVNIDPTNYSAHRLLADSYSALPRHEIARVSELFQSQMLQPINTTPIQPRLSESNLFLISAGGPGALSFNEFNPLFMRNGINVQASGLVGELGTYAGEAVVAGIYDKASFSVGYSNFETDGFRENAFQKDEIANAFLQVELSPEASVQFEYRYRDAERGDVRTRFFPEEFFPGQKNRDERNVSRLGARYNFSPNSILLGSFIYVNADVFGSNDEGLPFPLVSIDSEREGETTSNGEVQHLFRSRYVNLTTGVGYSDVNGQIDVAVMTVLPPPVDIIESVVPLDTEHANVYGYSYIKPLTDLTITLGVSFDDINSESPEIGDTNEVNPKLGVTWSPLSGTTVRGAAFKVFKRPLGTDQTLEPTQVAGFNQLFDDFDATKGWRYGAAIDQKFTKLVLGGLEFSKRELDVPALDQNGDAVRRDWEEYLGRGYLFFTPQEWLALRTEFAYERIEREEGLTDGVLEMKTYRVPLGANFFHPSGLSAFVTGTFVDQNGEFESISGGFQSGSDNFWIFDAGVRYRLPKRYGFITVGANNLFDESFNFFEIGFKNPTILPSRSVFVRATLAVP